MDCVDGRLGAVDGLGVEAFWRCCCDISDFSSLKLFECSFFFRYFFCKSLVILVNAWRTESLDETET